MSASVPSCTMSMIPTPVYHNWQRRLLHRDKLGCQSLCPHEGAGMRLQWLLSCWGGCGVSCGSSWPGTLCRGSTIVLQHLTSARPSAAATIAKAGEPTGYASLTTPHLVAMGWGSKRRYPPTPTHRCWQQRALGCAYMAQPVLHPAPAVPLSHQHVASAWDLLWVQVPCCLSLPAMHWWYVCPHTHMHTPLLNACVHRHVHLCAHTLAHPCACTPHPCTPTCKHPHIPESTPKVAHTFACPGTNTQTCTILQHVGHMHTYMHAHVHIHVCTSLHVQLHPRNVSP